MNEQPPSFDFQSLEQIANEVLDMNGRHYEEPLDGTMKPDQSNEHVNIFEAHNAAPMTNGVPKPDGSVDSAVSFPNHDFLEQHVSAPVIDSALTEQQVNGTTDSKAGATIEDPDMMFFHGLPPVQALIENGATSNGDPAPPPETTVSAPKADISTLPLYQPPAPPSQSPETVKRQPLLVNGASVHKRRRDSTPVASRPPSAKKARLDGEERAGKDLAVRESDDERMARLIQQEELGLRQRGK